MANQLQPHTLGTVLAFRYREMVTGSDPVEWTDLSDTPVTVVFDNGGTRHVFRWLNGGDDGVSEDGGTAIKFSQSPVWSAANLFGGVWEVRFASGVHATTQQLKLYGTMQVIDPSAGPLPTGGA